MGISARQKKLRKRKKRAKESGGGEEGGRWSLCSFCGELGDVESGFQAGGKPQYDSFLPRIASKLEVVRRLTRDSCREKILKQCPRCKSYFNYRTDYEYLAGGSEDEQFLTRLTGEEAEEYLAKGTG